MAHATVSSAQVRTHHRDGRPPQRWAVVAAHLVPLVTLPSGLWRLALVAGLPLGLRIDGAEVTVHGWEAVYITALSVVCELLALLTLGLVRPWGERAPAWLPIIGGRRVAPSAAVVPAALGAVALAFIWGWAFRDFPHVGEIDFSGPSGHVLLVVCYLPLLLWAPLLAAVTYAYYQRRCRD
jgi:hypothetical protein